MVLRHQSPLSQVRLLLPRRLGHDQARRLSRRAREVSRMNDLALLAIGCGFGLALALVAVMTYVLYRAASLARSATAAALTNVTSALAQQNLAIDKLRGEVSLSLSRMDAERLYSASLAIQRASRTLAQQTDTLQKALFAASPASPAIDFSEPAAFDLNDEAMDDQRLMQERARWQGAHSQQGQPQPQSSPLDALSEEEKAARVQEFFARRRNGISAANQPFPSSSAFPSTPPTAGSGAYASLVEQVAATQPFVPRAAPADFDDAGVGQEVDLDDKGELG